MKTIIAPNAIGKMQRAPVVILSPVVHGAAAARTTVDYTRPATATTCTIVAAAQ